MTSSIHQREFYQGGLLDWETEKKRHRASAGVRGRETERERHEAVKERDEEQRDGGPERDIDMRTKEKSRLRELEKTDTQKEEKRTGEAGREAVEAAQVRGR